MMVAVTLRSIFQRLNAFFRHSLQAYYPDASGTRTQYSGRVRNTCHSFTTRQVRVPVLTVYVMREACVYLCTTNRPGISSMEHQIES